MRDRQTCIGCGKKSPETETNYTLISAQFGWRLTRYRSGDGSIVIEWRCPQCWREYKKAKGEGSSAASSEREVAPRSATDAPRAPTAAPPPMRTRISSTPAPPATPRVAPSSSVPPREAREGSKSGRTPR